MPIKQMCQVIDQLRTVVLRDGGGYSDIELLERFVRDRDTAALAMLVERHGPMVWGVCRRLLSRHQDCEDAFQATFLVLVRKAASLTKRELLANWLYGVAQKTALRARSAAFKQAARERQVSDMPEPAAATDQLWDQMQPVFDEEMSRLPDKYRSVIVLCDLEGKSRREAAELLDCPEGTVAGRLARARALLAKRLARHGIVATGSILATLLTTEAATAAMPSTIVSSTVQAATLFAAGHAAASGVISANAVALSEGVLRAMLLSKLKIAAFAFVIAALLALGGANLCQNLAEAQTRGTDATPGVAAAQREQPKDGASLKGKIGAIDTQNRTITLVTTTFDRKAGEATEKETVLNIAKDAVITQDGVTTKLEDLKRGFTTTVKSNEKTALAITVDGATVKGQFKSMNSERNTITIVAGRDMGDKVYHLLKTTKVTVSGGKAGKVQDLQPGAEIVLTLSVLGDNTVVRIDPAQVVEKKKRGER